MPKKTLISFLLFLLAVLLAAPHALSWEISASNSMSFGSVAPGPSTAVIEIDASAGFARPSIFSGSPVLIPPEGYSGLLRITSNSTEAGQTISLSFPTTVILVRDNSVVTPLTVMRLDGFDSRSPALTVAVQGDVDIALGGKLEVKEYQVPGSYSGDLNLTVVFN
jgi:hypothetical protein